MRLRQADVYGGIRVNLRPRPGIPELLDALDRHQIPFGIASNSTLPWVEAHLEIVGLRAYFDVIVTRDQVKTPKPAPDSYLEACRRLGADPARSVAFEDSPFGVMAAKAAGMKCVACPSWLTVGRDFSEADSVVEQLSEAVLI